MLRHLLLMVEFQHHHHQNHQKHLKNLHPNLHLHHHQWKLLVLQSKNQFLSEMLVLVLVFRQFDFHFHHHQFEL
jgi:hypothetical protein